MALTTFHWLLALGMLVTGSINTLSTKAADNACSENRYGWKVSFDHPFVQAAGMFIGEFLCLIVYTLLSYRAKSRGDDSFPRAKPHSRLIYIIPACCDMTATSVMYVGLSLTSSSVFQMLRGSVIIFTSVLSRVFLKRPLRAHNLVGMACVVAGTAVVGTAGMICGGGDSGSSSSSKAMFGNVLIIVAQVIVAVQMVVEEKLLGAYDIPALQVVGWEGFWGFSVLSCVLTVMYFVPSPGSDFCTKPACGSDSSMVPPDWSDQVCSRFEDTVDAFHQIGNSAAVAGFLSLNILSIAFFNFLGVSVTKHVNAATRMVLDSLRTVIIWGFSLAVGWESFCWVQIIGFALLLTGTMVYNEILRVPGLSYAAVAPAEDKERLLDGLEGVGVAEGGLFGGDDYALLAADMSLNAAGPAYPVRGIKGVRK